jgi:hypothetical protein
MFSTYNSEKPCVKRGEWESRAAFRQHFEPTRPFGHGISNPTPYQARRPPLEVRGGAMRVMNVNVMPDKSCTLTPMKEWLPAATLQLLAATTTNNSFESYLKAQNKRNVKQIMCYAQRYHNILKTGDATPLVNLSGPVRRHAMESLSALSKYSGSYDRWQEIRRRYSLKWTNGNESLQSLERFFNPDLSFDVMLQHIKKMISLLPSHMGKVVEYGCLVGLRSAEIVESVRLINNKESFSKYYDSKEMMLCHWKFEQFLRKTKKAFISYITPEMLALVQSLVYCPTYNAIRHACLKKNIPCDMRFIRKLHASWLHESGIPDITVDMLQGRCPRSVLAQHYIIPNASLREGFAGFT